MRAREQEVGMRLAGDVAAELGIGVQTLHYYERENLIPSPQRSPAGYRLYPPELVRRLHFIRKAQGIGLSLGDIREVLKLSDQGASPCRQVTSALADKLAHVDQRLAELTAFRNELALLVAEATSSEQRRVARGKGVLCPIVETAPVLRDPDLVGHAQNTRIRPGLDSDS